MSTVYDEKLLDKVGLAMVPSGYTNNVPDVDNVNGALGKVYSVLPIQTVGDDIITNGTFDADANWSKGTGWDIIGGKAVCDGTQTANTTLVQQSTILGANLEILDNKTYRITLDVTVSSGAITYIELAGGVRNDDITQSQVGLTFDMKSGSSGNDRFTIAANSSFVGSVDNVKLQLISDGDFDFSRGSDATRVNSQGYIESVQVLSDELVQNGDFEDIGSELVTNGTFDTDSDWTKQTGWSISGGSANYDFTTNSTYLRQTLLSGGFVSGKSYRINFEITDGTAYMNIKSNAETLESTNLYSTGSYSIYVTASANGSDLLIYGLNTQGTAFSIDNISVKEVGQNWTFGDGVIVENGRVTKNDPSVGNTTAYQTGVFTVNGKYRYNLVLSGNITSSDKVVVFGKDFTSSGTYTGEYIATATSLNFSLRGSSNTYSIESVSVKEVTDDTDIPRLDYTNAACPSLLLEPERTNVITQSVLPTGWTSSVTGVVSTTAPDNSNNATSWAQSSSPTGYYKGATLQSTGDIIMSVFAKDINNSGDIGKIRVGSDNPYFGTGSETAYIEFDVSTETATSTTSGVLDYGYEKYKDNWYRVWVKANVPSQLTMNFIAYASKPSNSNAKIAVWGYQVENGSYPTSYIPTNGLFVTRNADICNNAGDSTIFNDSEGVLYAEVLRKSQDDPLGKITITANDNVNNLQIAFNTTNLQTLYVNNSVIQLNRTTDFSSYIGKYNKLAFLYSNNKFVLYINGVKVEEQLSGSTSAGDNFKSLHLLQQTGTGGEFYGGVRQVLYFNEALSDAELEYITSADIDLTIHNYKGSLSKISATYEDVGVKDRLTKLF